MSVQVLTPGIRPRTWAVTPFRTAAPHLWRGLDVLHLLGEGPPRNLVSGRAHGVLPSTSPTPITTEVGRAYTFDESDDYYTVTEEPAKTFPAGDWTAVLYLRATEITGSGFQYFISTGAFQATPSFNIQITEAGAVGSGQVEADIVDNSGNIQSVETATGVFPDPDFHLITLRKQGSSTTSMRLWIDGADATSTHDATAVLGEIGASTDLNIGRRGDGTSTRYFGGEISWWGKWSRALADDEIRTLAVDPFVHLRPRRRFVPTVTTAAGGGGPRAAHYYRRLMAGAGR